MEHKARLTTGDQSLESSNLELSAKDTPHEPLQLADKKVFPSPPLYHRESIISVCLDERSHHRVNGPSGHVLSSRHKYTIFKQIFNAFHPSSIPFPKRCSPKGRRKQVIAINGSR
ncbi:unnamed protein product [Pleuronectes platessa]|uniref:Uncharacterized protein n=1 Tax=Pleuronectes platessa TaxID=8262 RepID=A0A9N7V9K8_PLEPL|nr:unnamed protein product [Pleuronectes platessa]